MSAAVALLVYSVLLSTLGPRLLRARHWAERAPWLGVLAWQAAVASVIGGMVLAELMLAVPIVRAPHGLSDLLAACRIMLRVHYEGAPQPVAGYAGLLVAGGILLWISAHVLTTFVTIAVRRRRHARTLTMVARRRRDLEALVVEYDQPLAYCLPGRPHYVVVSTGVLDRLEDEQVSAVLAHERAHLAGRHDLAINIAIAVGRAFPAVPLLRAAKTEIPRLLEMRADDVAAREHDRVTLAAALVTVAEGRAPTMALGAGGGTALLRVRRLLAPHNPLTRIERLTGSVGIAMFVTLPLALAANPAVTALLERHCHFPV
ncbi:M56 family metallopeptidase [Spirillospora sp. CA-142024]|uniref:M56 family metallopeptidase n=1 Tax=Spirillospora sp. CA-142024 TaxID=3240036 RepID=UPI003D8DE9D1